MKPTETFKIGYDDYMNCQPFQSMTGGLAMQTAYENGRFFAIYCDVQGVKDPWSNFSFHIDQAKTLGYTRGM